MRRLNTWGRLTFDAHAAKAVCNRARVAGGENGITAGGGAQAPWPPLLPRRSFSRVRRLVKCNCRDRVRDEKSRMYHPSPWTMPVQMSTVHSNWPGTQRATQQATHFAPQSWGQPCQLPQHLVAHDLAKEHARVTALYHDVSSRLTALQQRHAQMEGSHSRCNAINSELHQLTHVLREKCNAEAERSLQKVAALEAANADLEHKNASL